MQRVLCFSLRQAGAVTSSDEAGAPRGWGRGLRERSTDSGNALVDGASEGQSVDVCTESPCLDFTLGPSF